MERRGFFKRLGAIGAGTAAVSALGAMPPDAAVEPVSFAHDGFDIQWTGWKAPHDQLTLSGQWVATTTDPMLRARIDHYWGTPYTAYPYDGIYVTVPGRIAWGYHEGDALNLTVTHETPHVTQRTSTADRRDAVMYGWRQLVEVLAAIRRGERDPNDLVREG